MSDKRDLDRIYKINKIKESPSRDLGEGGTPRRETRGLSVSLNRAWVGGSAPTPPAFDALSRQHDKKPAPRSPHVSDSLLASEGTSCTLLACCWLKAKNARAPGTPVPGQLHQPQRQGNGTSGRAPPSVKCQALTLCVKMNRISGMTRGLRTRPTYLVNLVNPV